MCGRACTPRTRAAARALTGAGSRLAAWPARPFKFLSHSAAAKRAQSADWHVARGRSASPRRRSWPPARAQRPRHSRSASRRRSASERANSHCAEIHTRTEIETGNDVRPRTADYENETYAVRRNRRPKSWGRFCCGRCLTINEELTRVACPRTTVCTHQFTYWARREATNGTARAHKTYPTQDTQRASHAGHSAAARLAAGEPATTSLARTRGHLPFGTGTCSSITKCIAIPPSHDRGARGSAARRLATPCTRGKGQGRSRRASRAATWPRHP